MNGEKTQSYTNNLQAAQMEIERLRAENDELKSQIEVIRYGVGGIRMLIKSIEEKLPQSED